MNDFTAFARGFGLILQHPISDGRWHRVPTEDKPHHRNGAYIWDGQSGAAKNWATMEKAQRFSWSGSALPVVNRSKVIRDEQAKHARAAQEASRMLSNAVLDSHPYLKRKGFPKALGLVLDGKLLIPMRDYRNGDILSVQSIGDEKKFLYGGRTRGAVFVIGKKSATQSWLVEGYATGLSVKAALDAMYVEAKVVVCFSASNLQYVAERISGNRFVFADHDESGTGQRVAETTGLPWVMSPVMGEDANDLHQRAGIWEVIKVMKAER